MFRTLALAIAVGVLAGCNPAPTEQEQNLPAVGSAPEMMPDATATNLPSDSEQDAFANADTGNAQNADVNGSTGLQ